MSDPAIATIVTGLVTITTMIVGFLTLWVKLRYGVESKITANTELTRAGTATATANAKIAASAASIAAEKAVLTENKITSMLNGELDTRMRGIVKESFDVLNTTFSAHAEQDDKNMKEIRDALSGLIDKIKS